MVDLKDLLGSGDKGTDMAEMREAEHATPPPIRTSFSLPHDSSLPKRLEAERQSRGLRSISEVVRVLLEEALEWEGR